jgi:drug/metabolite transporter (DMT)-like permease
VADFVAGLASRRRSAIVVLLVGQAAGVVIAGAIIAAVGEAAPGQRAIVLSALAGAAGAVALGAFYRGLAVGTMSIVAPISASGVALPVVVGVATGDRPTALQGVGLALTVTGVVLASREAEEEALPDARRSVVLALVAATGLGLYFVLSDDAADESVLWLLLVARATAAVLLTGAALATRAFAEPAPRPRELSTLVLVGVLDLAATGLFGIASTKGLISVVAVVGALYPVTTVLLARAVLGERLARGQAAGVALAFTGVAAVAAGAA